MQSNYAEALRRLLVHEGGYSNHPLDPGGPTNYGITLQDYRQYIKSTGSADDVEHMTVDQASIIYAEHYAKPLRFSELPNGVDYAIFDYGVNSGIARASRVLRSGPRFSVRTTPGKRQRRSLPRPYGRWRRRRNRPSRRPRLSGR